MPSDPKSRVGLGYLLTDITRHLRKHFDRRSVRFGLTRAQWRALKTLEHHEGLSQAELAEMIEMEPIPVGRVIDRLEQADFVERRPDPSDRRCWRLYLTPRSHAVVDDMETIAAELRADALQGIARTDVDTLVAVLNRMKDNLLALDGAPDKTDRP